MVGTYSLHTALALDGLATLRRASMNIIDRYLWKSVLVGLAMAWFALTLLVVFFDFIGESGDLNENYNSLQAFIFLLYSIPSRLYELFPTSMLIGTLLGLGTLAANSEFIAMRAAGISVGNIIFSVLKVGVILVGLVFLMGEYVVPKADLAGRNFKSSLSNKNIVMTQGASLWIKDQNRIIHIGQVWSEDKLTDVTIYTLKSDYSGLESQTHVETITSSDQGWEMSATTEQTFSKAGVDTQFLEKKVDANLLNPKFISIASVQPEQLSISELSELIEYQQSNNLNTDKLKLAYWKRFSAPFSALVMLFLAMPFLFGSQRGGGAGQRVFIGIIAGIAFFLINKVLNQLGSVYGVTPLLSAFSPALIFLGISIITLQRIR
ncbi:LPS export ABC transporter permease LptG [Leucothrix arctica]|uniref:LPS export ABC transporter permease LptG n=2 Tax=Leucothrix arctica TaxID=1481894 RepID=A0A317C7L1_9GAMM|nr:LPS export ABC transporter permease LptG [Leucothrix arctica]